MTPLNRKRIEEIRDGCKGVTPGPWKPFRAAREWFTGLGERHSEFIDYGSVIPVRVGSGYDLPKGAERSECDIRGYQNCVHIANCDPDTIKALCTLALDAEKYREALESAKETLITELNMSNYSHDDVDKLNDEVFEAYHIIVSALQPKDSQ